jgi:hypothetical protein
MERREFAGSVLSTTLSANVANSASSISVGSGSSFPTGANNPFAIVVSRGDAAEEKMLVSSRSGETLTISVRGYDGTTAQNHLTGAVVDHVLDANTIQSMNTYTYDTAILQWMEI